MIAAIGPPPTYEELVLEAGTEPGAWESACWEPEPEPWTAESLAEFRARHGEPDDLPTDADQATAIESARHAARIARVDRYAEHYALPPVRTCSDVFRLVTAAGLLRAYNDDGVRRYRLPWPVPQPADVFPVTAADAQADEEWRTQRRLRQQ